MKHRAMLTVFSLVLCAAFVSTVEAQEVLPRPEQPFGGKIGRTTKESVKDFPKAVEAPKGAPNILVILTDDVGFGASSSIWRANPDADDGPAGKERAALQSVSHHGALLAHACCSAERAQSSQRRHGRHYGSRHWFPPGYNTLMPKSAGTFAEILKQNGWNTSWYAKNHNVPDWQSSQAGPFDLWPTGLGFEYFYGFIGHT